MSGMALAEMTRVAEHHRNGSGWGKNVVIFAHISFRNFDVKLNGIGIGAACVCVCAPGHHTTGHTTAIDSPLTRPDQSEEKNNTKMKLSSSNNARCH